MSAFYVDTCPFILMFIKVFFMHHFQLCELFSIKYMTCLWYSINLDFLILHNFICTISRYKIWVVNHITYYNNVFWMFRLPFYCFDFAPFGWVFLQSSWVSFIHKFIQQIGIWPYYVLGTVVGIELRYWYRISVFQCGVIVLANFVFFIMPLKLLF